MGSVLDLGTGLSVVGAYGLPKAYSVVTKVRRDGKGFVVGDWQSALYQVEPNTGAVVAFSQFIPAQLGISMSITALATSKSGLVAVGTTLPQLLVRKLDTGAKVIDINLPSPPVDMEFTGNGSKLIVSLSDYTLRLYDVATGSEVQRFETGGYISCLGVNPNVSTLATGDSGGLVKLWKIGSTLTYLRTLEKKPNGIQRVDFTKDGSKVAVLYYPNVDLHRVSDAVRLGRAAPTLYQFNDVRVSPDNTRVVTIDAEGNLDFRSIPSLKVLGTIRLGTGMVTGIDFTSSGDALAYRYSAGGMGMIGNPLASYVAGAEPSHVAVIGGKSMDLGFYLSAPTMSEQAIQVSADSLMLYPHDSTVIVHGSSTVGSTKLYTEVTAVPTVANVALQLGLARLIVPILILPPEIDAFWYNTLTVKGGNSMTFQVRLDPWAPPGGMQVALSSDNPAVVVPASVTVGQGLALSPVVTVNSIPVTTRTQARITARFGASSKTLVIDVVP